MLPLVIMKAFMWNKNNYEGFVEYSDTNSGSSSYGEASPASKVTALQQVE